MNKDQHDLFSGGFLKGSRPLTKNSNYQQLQLQNLPLIQEIIYECKIFNIYLISKNQSSSNCKNMPIPLVYSVNELFWIINIPFQNFFCKISIYYELWNSIWTSLFRISISLFAAHLRREMKPVCCWIKTILSIKRK